MELITTNYIDSLPPALKPFAAARIGQKAIKDLSPIEVSKSCAEIINRSFVEAGHIKAEKEMLEFNRDVLFNELKGKFASLTINEVKEAFRIGIRGESGAWFGLCAKTYHQFLKYYFEKPERSESMKAYLTIADKANDLTKQVTESDKEKIMREASLKEFDEYCKEKELSRSAPYVYDFIAKVHGYKAYLSGDEIRVLFNDRETRESIKKLAKAQYKNELNKKILKGEVRKKDAENALFDLVTNRTYLNVAKTIELKMYFDKLIESKKKLEL